MSTVKTSDVIAETLDREFEEIFRQHHDMAYRTAYGVTGSVVDAEDIVQTVFLRLLDRGLPPHLKRNAQGYAVVLAKGGPAFKETTGVEGYLEPSSQLSTSRSLHGKFRMTTFAQLMTDYIGGGTEVGDMTGLPALYEIHLVLNRVGASGGVRTAEGPEPGTNLGVFDPPFFKAVEQQLGLRIEARKIPVDILIIDHVEKATDN